ncbi:hypothetical protein ACSW29_27765 [Rhodococcus sp. GB-02]
MKGWEKINKEINYGRVGAWVSIGSIAVGLSVIVGCSAAVTGSAVPNESQADAYQSEVSISVAAASSSKAAADAAEAAFEICEEAVSRSKNDVVAFNAYVDAGNQGATDLRVEASTAASSARDTASWFDSVSSELPAALSGLFDELATNLRSSAAVIESDHSADEINSISDASNSIRKSISEECASL